MRGRGETGPRARLDAMLKGEVCYLIHEFVAHHLIGSDGQLFATLAREQPDFASKVIPVEGELTEPSLGLSETDQAMLAQE